MAKNTHTLDTFEHFQLGWQDLRVPLTRATIGANNPALTKFRDDNDASTGVFAYAFSKTTEQQLWFDVQLPHGIVGGATTPTVDGPLEVAGEIRPHIHWSPGASVDTGSVVWGLEYSWANAVEQPDNTFGYTTIDTVADPNDGVAYEHRIAAFAAVDITGMRDSAILLCRVFRQAGSDDFDDVAFGLSIDFHYQTRYYGSAAEYPSA